MYFRPDERLNDCGEFITDAAPVTLRGRGNSGLSYPGWLGDLAPASTNALEHFLGQRPRCNGRTVFRESSWLSRSDDRCMNPRYAQGKTKRVGNRPFQTTQQQFIFQLLQPFPVGPGIGISGRPITVLPGNVSDRTFGDDADVVLFRQREREVERFLIGDADGCLQRIELSAFDGV